MCQALFQLYVSTHLILIQPCGIDAIIPSMFRWENWGTIQGHRVLSGRGEIRSQVFDSRIWSLNHHAIYCPLKGKHQLTNIAWAAPTAMEAIKEGGHWTVAKRTPVDWTNYQAKPQWGQSHVLREVQVEDLWGFSCWNSHALNHSWTNNTLVEVMYMISLILSVALWGILQMRNPRAAILSNLSKISLLQVVEVGLGFLAHCSFPQNYRSL